MSSESAANLTVTSSQSVQHVSNCVTQLNSNSIEIHVLATILDHRVFVLDQWVFVLDHRVFGLRSSFLGLRFRHIIRPDEAEVDVEARGIWNRSLSSSWTPEKERPAAARTLLGVEPTSFGFVGRLLIAPTSLLTMLVI